MTADGEQLPDFEALADVRIDAWTGEEAARGQMGAGRDGWAVTSAVLPAGLAMYPEPPDPANWRDPRIGWGLVLPDREGWSPEQLARAEDAPDPLQELLRHRPASKVLRYRAGAYQDWVLRDYANEGDRVPATAPVGTGPKDVPGYLLISASPAEIPWDVQYQLNLVRNVGRLDLPPEGLANYVRALIDDWSDSATEYAAPVVWAVDHGPEDITALMRDAVAVPVHQAFVADGDLPDATLVDGRMATATGSALLAALKEHRPSVVVTTSHGQTGPIEDPHLMRERLGALVDQNHSPVDPATLLAGWQPDGAVWFAQACCSAGARKPSLYDGMFDPTSMVGAVLDAVAGVGPAVAPLPQALLGADRPLRAFIGHVEPTFDWTMVFPPTKEQLTDWVRALIYMGICAGRPIGLAMDDARLYEPVGALLFRHTQAVTRYSRARQSEARRPALNLALYSKVTAYDRACTVLLGDPTVAIPLPKRD